MGFDLTNYREHYTEGRLDEPLPDDPFDLLELWMEEAIADERIKEPNAFSLATISPEGKPEVRLVLVKQIRNGGLIFYTNYESGKGKSLAVNPFAAGTIWWPEAERQVRFQGEVKKITEAESEKYFHSRPKGSQLGAYASPQSEVIPSSDFLEVRLKKAMEKFKNEENVPLPKHWGGFFIRAEMMEFWQGRPNRLHDRFRYECIDNQWIRNRLAP